MQSRVGVEEGCGWEREIGYEISLELNSLSIIEKEKTEKAPYNEMSRRRFAAVQGSNK